MIIDSGPHSASRATSPTTALEQSSGAAGQARTMMGLQRTVGNARLSRMLGTTVQTKLTVGAPHDPYEQEADQRACRHRDADDRTPSLGGETDSGQTQALVLSETRRSCVGSLWKKIVSRSPITTTPAQTPGVIQRQEEEGGATGEAEAKATQQPEVNADSKRKIAAIALAEACIRRKILTFPLCCFDQIAGCFPKRTP